MEGRTKAHCHKTSGRFPICILHLSFGSQGNRLPSGEQTTQTCSSPRVTLSFSGYKPKSTLIELANSLRFYAPHSVKENFNFGPVRLAGKTADADADADLLGEKNTLILLKRYG